jgi:hypothetical protein
MTLQDVKQDHSQTVRGAENLAPVAREIPLRLLNSDPLHVLLVTPRYFPYMGGVENHVYQVARRFAQVGVDVTVLTADPSGRLPAQEQVEDVRIQRVRAWPAKQDYYFAPGIYRTIMRGSWDIIHIQSYHTLVAPLVLCYS